MKLTHDYTYVFRCQTCSKRTSLTTAALFSAHIFAALLIRYEGYRASLLRTFFTLSATTRSMDFEGPPPASRDDDDIVPLAEIEPLLT